MVDDLGYDFDDEIFYGWCWDFFSCCLLCESTV